MRPPRPLPAATAALLFTLLVSSVTSAAIPAPAAAVLLAFAAVSAWRPDRGLLLLAAVLPISSWLGRIWASGFMWPDALIVAFGAGYFAAAAIRERRPPDVALSTAIVLLATIVVASLAVQLAVVQERLGTQAFGAVLWRTMAQDLFVPQRAVPALSASVLLLEGLMLLHAAAAVSRSFPTFVPRAARAIVTGAALAAAVTLGRIVVAALRGPAPLEAFASYLATVRLSVTFSDVNAAGSFFVMALAVAAALGLRRRVTGWSVATALAAAGLWMSGSRAALIAGAVSLGLPLTGPVWSRVRTAGAVRVALVGLALAVVIAGMLLLPARGSQQSPSIALRVRTELARTSLRMFASQPVFGIGIGEFYQRSGEFSSPELIALFPPARNENAHNYLLQVLAELGVIGLGASIWLLTIAAKNTWARLRSPESDRLIWGVATGLLAFGLTSFAGHPLLVSEAAGPFWILFGVAAGAGSAIEVRERARTIHGRLLVAAVAILIATFPIRARQQLSASNLEHVGIDLSGWRFSEDGTRYREAGSTCSVFVPARAGWIAIPLRAARPGVLLDVEVWLDGRLVNIVRVPADRWYTLRLVVPAGHDGPKFKRVDLRVPASQGASVVLLVGKVVAPQ
jgi:O-antigen ligase